MNKIIIFLILFYMLPLASASIDVSSGMAFQTSDATYAPNAFSASDITLNATNFCIDSLCYPVSVVSLGSGGGGSSIEHSGVTIIYPNGSLSLIDIASTQIQEKVNGLNPVSIIAIMIIIVAALILVKKKAF